MSRKKAVLIFSLLLTILLALPLVSAIFHLNLSAQLQAEVDRWSQYIDKKPEPSVKGLNTKDYYLVTRVVDGDTIKIQTDNGEETVRLLGIDTPETKDPRTDVQCFDIEASEKAKELMERKNVRLEDDPTQTDKDRYGRLLRYVYLEDGTLVNAELVRLGYAFAYKEYPVQKLSEFELLERQAKEENRGLWGQCSIL